MVDRVSRETTPAEAASHFGSRLSVAEELADILATEGVLRGMVGPREVGRIWSRHLMNCAVVVPRLNRGLTVADVGSGGGLPGVVWAIARPDLSLTLIEPLLRRTTFLEEVVTQLDLPNIEVVRARAEDVDRSFDVVTARAVARLDKLARWCMPLVTKQNGLFLALKGASVQDEVAEAKPTLHRLGARDVSITYYGESDAPTTVVEVTT